MSRSHDLGNPVWTLSCPTVSTSADWNLPLCLFCLHQSMNIFLRSFYFAEYEVLTARLANTKLPGFHPLWCVTVYVIGRQNCQTPSAQYTGMIVHSGAHWSCCGSLASHVDTCEDETPLAGSPADGEMAKEVQSVMMDSFVRICHLWPRSVSAALFNTENFPLISVEAAFSSIVREWTHRWEDTVHPMIVDRDLVGAGVYDTGRRKAIPGKVSWDVVAWDLHCLKWCTAIVEDSS